MPSSDNKIIIACAGAGKTTRLVHDALANRDRRIAIITYTNFNTHEIRKRFNVLNSGVPKHVDVMTWFGFLLRECARPYQRAKYTEKRISSIAFVNHRSAKGAKEMNTKRYYFANGDTIYSDKIAQFVVECEIRSRNAVTSRLSQIYTDLYIDEFQDLSGWDLDFIGALLNSDIRITLVGDPRQHTYSTSPSPKNRHYLGIKIADLMKQWERKGLCSIEYMAATHRCNRHICEFSNSLWPGMEAMTPLRNDTTDHDGVFLVADHFANRYIARFMPQVLRYNRTAKSYGCEALNFGQAKGLEFKRVLIVSTDPISKYLRTGELHWIEASKDKLHVAVTRAWHSVAFIHDGPSAIVTNRWTD